MEGERILGSKHQFCAAFYHVHEWYHRQEKRKREHFCFDEDNCIVAQEAKGHIKKFVDNAKKFAEISKEFAEKADPLEDALAQLQLLKAADRLVEEAEKLAEKRKISRQEANEFVQKAKESSGQNLVSVKQLAETERKAVYAWCAQAKTVVAVVKFEKLDGNILYEARYTNCGKKQKHAEDFFQEDIEKGELGEKVKANPKGTITLYLTLQPCNKSTSIEGTANTPKDKTCCETLTTIEILLPRKIKLCVKAANTCRLSLTEEKDSDDETLRNNAVDGIKMLMQAGVDVSGMTKDDWDYLLAMTNPDVPRNYHERRKDLDKSVQKTFTDIKFLLNLKKPKKQSSSKKS